MVTQIQDITAGALLYNYVGALDALVVEYYMQNSDTFGLLTYAFSGKDTLNGGALSDLLYGFAGADTVAGKCGKDYLGGGLGKNTLIGGRSRISSGSTRRWTPRPTSTRSPISQLRSVTRSCRRISSLRSGRSAFSGQPTSTSGQP